MENKLIKVLKKFEYLRRKELGPSESAVFPPDKKGAEMIAKVFLPIAKYAIYGGHFHVEYTNNEGRSGYDIKLNKIELYYHDENEGGHIDPIMYHTNLHTPKYLTKYPYYELGALNLHTSGIDVCFENEAKKYRASFLIRNFTVYGENIADIKADPCSTHAFDWFFPNGICKKTLNQITWIEDIPYEQTEKAAINQDVRQNVSQYRKINDKKNDKDKYEKILDTQSPKKKAYIPCNKKWQFIRVEE